MLFTLKTPSATFIGLLCLLGGMSLSDDQTAAAERDVGKDAVRYEPVYELEMDIRSSSPEFGEDTSRGRRTDLDSASWLAHVNDRAMPPQGFAETRTKQTVEWAGREVAGESVVWTADRSRGWRYLSVRKFEIVRSTEVPVPHFMLPFESTKRIPVPAGTIRMRSEPDDQNDWTWVVDYEHVGPKKFDLRDRRIDAHEFRWTIDRIEDDQSSRFSSGRIVLSSEIVGGLCEMEEREKVEGGFSEFEMKSRSVTRLPVPKGIRAFRDYGFGLAPFSGYEFVEPKDGELARMVDDDGYVLTVRAADARGLDIEEWWEETKPQDATTVRHRLHLRDGVGPLDIKSKTEEVCFRSGPHVIMIRHHLILAHYRIAEGWRWIAE